MSRPCLYYSESLPGQFRNPDWSSPLGIEKVLRLRSAGWTGPKPSGLYWWWLRVGWKLPGQTERWHKVISSFLMGKFLQFIEVRKLELAFYCKFLTSFVIALKVLQVGFAIERVTGLTQSNANSRVRVTFRRSIVRGNVAEWLNSTLLGIVSRLIAITRMVLIGWKIGCSREAEFVCSVLRCKSLVLPH